MLQLTPQMNDAILRNNKLVDTLTGARKRYNLIFHKFISSFIGWIHKVILNQDKGARDSMYVCMYALFLSTNTSLPS